MKRRDVINKLLDLKKSFVFLSKTTSLFLLIFLSLLNAQAQEKIIRGFVKDSLNVPLENGTIIATPLLKDYKIKYTITDSLGYFELAIVDSLDYNLNISYLGFEELSVIIKSSEKKNPYTFVLNKQSEDLKTVIINYKYKAIEQKKDTLTYRISAFVNGNETKMQDVLDKLPGLSVDNNVIKVKGETIKKLLVEGKSFFGGGNKLALENIPADVIEKIEIISDFNEDELLRNITDNNTLALNVVLKKDKKNFIFGSIEAGLGLQSFYSIHPSLFKYKPKANFSFIGDINNYNSSSITFSDLLRLSGGVGNLFDKNSNYKDLYNFASSTNDRFESKSKFSALNFYHTFNDIFTVEGFAIIAEDAITYKTTSIIEYINDDPIIESRNSLKLTDNTSAIVNLKANYKPNIKQRWSYDAKLISNLSDFQNAIISNALLSNTFDNNDDSRNTNFKHYLEGFYRLGEKHTLGVGLKQSYSKTKFLKDWSSNTIFLESFYPLVESNLYKLAQSQDLVKNTLDLKIKDYYLLNNNNHLFGSISFSNLQSKIDITEKQVLDDNSSIDFSENDTNFGNNLDLNLRDFEIALGLKKRISSITLTAELKMHNYEFKNIQNLEQKEKSFFLEPKVDIEYTISKDASLGLSYNYINNYFSPNVYLENITIINFNNIFIGNSNIFDEKSHSLNLDYSTYSSVSNMFLDVGIDYISKNPVLNNSIIQNGINQELKPVLLNLPDESISLFTDISKEIKKGSIDVSFNVDWSKYNQVINNDVDIIKTNNIDASVKLTKKLSKKTFIKLGYDFNNSHVNDGDKNVFTSHKWFVNFDTKLLKNFVLNANTDYFSINDYTGESNTYLISKFDITYRKKNSKWSYSILGDNIFNNGIVISNTFSSNIIRTQKVFTLPAVFVLKIDYKF